MMSEKLMKMDTMPASSDTFHAQTHCYNSSLYLVPYTLTESRLSKPRFLPIAAIFSVISLTRLLTLSNSFVPSGNNFF